MSYKIEIIVYNNGCEIKDNQGYKYYYSGSDDVGRTNDIETLVKWLKGDLPNRGVE